MRVCMHIHACTDADEMPKSAAELEHTKHLLKQFAKERMSLTSSHSVTVFALNIVARQIGTA